MIRPTPEFLSLLENKCIEILVKTFVRYSGLKVEVTQVNDDIPHGYRPSKADNSESR